MDETDRWTTGALEADVRAVVQRASCAPSVHNTQPWHFTWDGRALTVREAPSHSLPVLDPSGRERRLSCGAAALTARLAFAELGWAVEADSRPDPGDPLLVARLTVTGRRTPTAQELALARAVPYRATDRDPFDARPLSEDVRRALASAAAVEGAWVRWIGLAPDDDVAVELQVLLSHADASQRSDPAYLAELAAWRRGDGTEGVPDSALPSVPVEDRGSSWVLRDFDAGRPATRRGDGPAADPPVAEHPAVLVLGTPADAPEDWVVAGQALARVLLQATVDAVAAQPLTAVLEVPVLRAQVRHALGVVGHPQVLLRMGHGHGHGVPTSPRRPVEQVLTVLPSPQSGSG